MLLHLVPGSGELAVKKCDTSAAATLIKLPATVPYTLSEPNALLLDKAEMKTVPIMIAQLRSADYSKFDMGKVYMFILLSILPVLIIYVILSKSIIKGVTSGSVKG